VIFILLPAFNEEESIERLFIKLDDFFKKDFNTDYRILICDDGSTDKTLSEIKKLESKYPVDILIHKINRGLGETMRDLIERAVEMADDNDVIVRMDCDVSHEPIFIKGMIDKLLEGYDVVIASRFVEGGGTVGLNKYRTLISLMAQRFMRFFFRVKGLKEYSSGYRAYTGKVLKHAVRVYGNNFIQLKGLGFTGTLEKVVKLKLINARFAEAPLVLRYDQKLSSSKMVASITTLGYLILVILYYWPFGGWKRSYKKLEKINE
jgi:dolichol-phosphate mannosyltransferase